MIHEGLLPMASIPSSLPPLGVHFSTSRALIVPPEPEREWQIVLYAIHPTIITIVITYVCVGWHS
jgi:hypothetical protein